MRRSIDLINCNVGTHNITAKYLGDATYNISTSAARSQKIVKVNPTAVALASSTATPAASTAFTLTATVTTPATTSATGTINFRNASNASLTGCGAVNLTGTGATKTATCSVTETTAGAKSYTARYSGDTNFSERRSEASVGRKEHSVFRRIMDERRKSRKYLRRRFGTFRKKPV